MPKVANFDGPTTRRTMRKPAMAPTLKLRAALSRGSLQKPATDHVRLGLFASFGSLAGRFWSTPISGHISRLSWVENEPHAGRVFTLEESLVCVLPFSRASMKFVEQSNFTDRDAAGTPAHRDRQHDSGVNLFRESVLTRGNMNQIHATT
jgi:hypothetical protein